MEGFQMFVFVIYSAKEEKNLISGLMGAIICQSATGELNTITGNPRSSIPFQIIA